MSTHTPLTWRRLAWPCMGTVCLGTVLVVAGCSRQSASTAPSPVSRAAGAEHVHSSSVSDQLPEVASRLAAVRAATAKYHDISKALADGYQLGYKGAASGCVANPGVGAMGYHYFNWAKMEDPSIIDGDPEVLVYYTGEDGTLALGAVEWVVPKTLWEEAGNTEAPVVFGQSLHILNPVLNWYVAHAWLWKRNPAGMFADWNPDVICP